ncbi:UNVERIFIED_CONTAM: hypothetical protein GTU68_012109, partial [Idotea baltica]|nr:hypothetical protein [Idotea baltica]
MSNSPQKIAVLGAGAWGTALARLAALNGNSVTLWARNPAHADIADLKTAEIVILAIPSAAILQALDDVGDALPPKAPLVIVTKGLEAKTGRCLSDVVAEALPQRPIAALSGPSFAADVAAGLPTAVTLASDSKSAAIAIRDCLACATFRIYLSDDLIGTELGGAAKNVLAIAAGVAEGMGLGASAKAAL